MAFDPAKHPIAELRRRFVDAGEPVSGRLLEKLHRDPRSGVRALADSLDRRRRAEREERLRLDAMLNFERVLWRSGVRHLAGVDEAGVGPLAGPVVAAAVVFHPGEVAIAGVDDSKRLDEATREAVAAEIHRHAAGVGVGVAEVAEIDELNVYHAALLAMRRAVEALPMRPEHLLVDAREIPGLDVPQNPFDKGDGIDFSIAAASIVAKTHRDRLMVELDARHPGYGFARHKGYGTAEHREAIRRRGPSPVHRRSFGVLAELCGDASPAFYRLERRLEELRHHRDGLTHFEAELDDARDQLAEREHRKLRLLLGRRWKTL